MGNGGENSGWGLPTGTAGKINRPNRKKLLAMTIDSDTNEHGASRETIRRNCENAWSHSVYSALERLFSAALRGYGLLFQRLGGECASVAESST